MTFTKLTRNALFVCAFPVFAAGCGPQPTIGAPNLPLSGSTRTGSLLRATAAAPPLRVRRLTPNVEFLYAVEVHHVDALTINPRSGALAKVNGSPYAPGYCYGTHTMAFTPSGRYLYVASGNGLLAFSANRRTGGLTQLSGSPYAVSGNSPVVDLTGKFLFVAAGTNIAAYKSAPAMGA